MYFMLNRKIFCFSSSPALVCSFQCQCNIRSSVLANGDAVVSALRSQRLALPLAAQGIMATMAG